MSKTVLMITGDYTEDYGSMVPFQTLLALGHTVHAVCPGKRAGEKIATAIREFDGAQTYTERPGHSFTLNASFEDLVVEDYDALVIPGGRAPEYLRLDDEVQLAIEAGVMALPPSASSKRRWTSWSTMTLFGIVCALPVTQGFG